MMTVQELTERYRSFSDEELLRTNKKIEGYSTEAKLALEKVLQERGGAEAMEDKIEKQLALAQKEKDTKFSISVMLKQGKSKMDIHKELNSDIFSAGKINSFIEEKIAELEAVTRDKKITFRAVAGSLLGALVGGTLSGIVWGLMLYGEHIFFLIAFGLALFCFFMVRVFAGRSKRNVIVIIATVVAIIYALLVGELALAVFNYIL
jgi:hypothetical protein